MILFKNSKIYGLLLACSLIFLASCQSDKQKIQKQVEQQHVSSEVIRFDQLFFQSDLQAFKQLRSLYPYMFIEDTSDEFWLSKKDDPLFIELNSEVNSTYTRIDDMQRELEQFFKATHYYFQDPYTDKKILTIISEVDTRHKAVFADSIVLISLDTYLGQNHKFYQGFSEYLKPMFNSNQILPDLAQNYVEQKITQQKDRTFLSQIIYWGKIYYVEQQLLTGISQNHEIIGYSIEQWDWAQSNQEQIWKYFLENELFYSTDNKLKMRFIDPAPFSKFYLEIDEQTPGKIGSFMGWQIVSSYMKNNNVTLQELLNKSAEEIFQQSKYKPQKS